MRLNIRQIRKYEIEELADMWYELARMHEEIMEGYELASDPKRMWINFIKEGVEKEGMVTFVAEKEDELVGFVNVVLRQRPPFFSKRDVGLILDLFVKEGERGKGIGSTLVEAAERWIKNKGFKLAIMTVSPVNKNALEFWNNKGYDTYLEKKRKEL
ncbi:MAG: GNAT family N-acetyltransferase [Candidatus Saliniplasma sp.]